VNLPARNARASKAAMLLLALGGGKGSSLIKEFQADEIRSFASTAASIDRIDPALLEELIDEFSLEMSKPAPIEGGDAKALSLLREALPPEDVEKALGPQGAIFVPVWDKFAAGGENLLVPYLLDEHPQTVAFIVSQLDPALSARIVSILPGDLRDTVARRLLKLGQVDQKLSELVQSAMRQDLLAETGGNLETEGRNRMAALLNRMERQQVEQIITSLRRERPEDAAALKKMLFSFEDLPRIEQKHRLVLFDKVQTEQVMLALRGCDGEIKETVLSSLGARARRMIEAELSSASPEVTNEVIGARQAVAQMALNLAANGDIVIRDTDEAAPATAPAPEGAAQ
jgi:flagellar motor switch protein FliG